MTLFGKAGLYTIIGMVSKKIPSWRQLPDDLLATLCDVPIAIVKAMKYGKHNFTENEQKIILKYCEKWSNRE
jgi:hypothetical protein